MIADQHPEFAGLFYDGQGQLVVKMKDPARLPDIADRLVDFLEPSVAPEASAYRAEVTQRVANARSQSAEYDFRELYDWYQELSSVVLEAHEVTFSDIDEVQNRIVLGAPDATSIEAVLQTVNRTSVPPAAVIVKQVDRAVVAFAPVVYSMQQKVRPIVGGVKMTTVVPCTLGYNVGHHYGGQYVDEYFATNAHCTDVFGAPTGWVGAGQVSKYTDPIGSEVADLPLFTHSTDPACPSGRMCRYSDAALFDYNATTTFSHSLVAWPSIGSTSFSSTRQIVGGGDPIIGMTVHKIGQSSGRHSGTVTATCAKVPQYNPDQTDTGRTMLCQGQATYSVQGGDSGGAVVEVWGGGVVQRGLNWGVGGYFSKGNEWLREMREALGSGHTLGTTAAAGPAPPPPPLTATIGGPSEVPEGGWCTWQGFASGGTGSYNFSWSGVLYGSGTPISGSIGGSGALYLTVTSGSQTAYAQLGISIDEQAEECLE
jgi:hypothetical protein